MERHNCLMIFCFLIRGVFLIIFGSLTLYTALYPRYSVLSTLYPVCTPLYSLLITLYSVRLPLYSVLRSILAVQLSLYSFSIRFDANILLLGANNLLLGAQQFGSYRIIFGAF
ncbi:unnamed protein product, partial [Porites evermanni]